MYLQTGEEHQWMTQLRNSMGVEAAHRYPAAGAPSEPRTAKASLKDHDDLAPTLKGRARTGAVRVLSLLRPAWRTSARGGGMGPDRSNVQEPVS